ncbi:MAG: ribonuclease J, partial [Oscillospiraceae bacterium]|nr:ribonuclease J [Oscillospiraceae bacterium]
MAEKLKIISLGGLGEIGKNLTVYEYGGDILIVDCGMGFPEDDMYGIDIIIPDFTYLVKNKDRIRALAVTHGHEDHIGGIPYLLNEINVPIYATRLTAGLIEAKLSEFDLPEKPVINTVNAGESFKAGCFKVELIHVNHSVADAVALAIKTPVGVIIHTGDYKIDATPIDGDMIDIHRLCELGKKGVLALCADSTNAERPGYSRSERKVGDSLDLEFKDCDKRIIVTTFASNVHRIQQVINSAARYGRKVALTGRSMENVMRVATELGYMKIPEGTLVDINQLKNLPRDKAVVITTGSQGESMSALYRMAFTGHKQIEIGATDKVILSASAIPGNENSISKVIDELLRKGADVVYDRASDLHASGHACREELKIMLGIVRPKFFIPLHGEYRHLRAHAQLAEVMGIPTKNILISEIGTVMELSGRSIKKNGTVPAGRTFVDGSGVGDVGSVVLRDRKHLAQDGMLVVVVSISDEDGEIVSGPDIITRGFVYVKESEEL